MFRNLFGFAAQSCEPVLVKAFPSIDVLAAALGSTPSEINALPDEDIAELLFAYTHGQPWQAYHAPLAT